MKNLVLNADGFPQAITDYWTLLDSNTKDVITLLMKPYGDNVIISGCAQTVAGANLNIAAGIVYHAGLIMRVEAHTIAAYAGGTLIAQKYDSVLLTNPKDYGNGAIDEPMLTETSCRFVKRVAEDDYVELQNFMPFGKLTVGVEDAGYTLAAGVTQEVGNELVIEKLFNNRLVIKGAVEFPDDAGTTINGVQYCVLLATLDVGFRPTVKKEFGSYYNYDITSLTGVLSCINRPFVLFPDGKLCIIKMATDASDYHEFNNTEVIF